MIASGHKAGIAIMGLADHTPLSLEIENSLTTSNVAIDISV